MVYLNATVRWLRNLFNLLPHVFLIFSVKGEFVLQIDISVLLRANTHRDFFVPTDDITF